MLAGPNSYIGKRAGFASKYLWVTPYDPNEMYCSGMYPNQNKGDGLQYYVEKNRPIENTDIVVWHTYGHTHVCKPEDFPIMPVEYVGFSLKPNNFFDGNPAMDLPKEVDGYSVDTASASGSCCSK